MLISSHILTELATFCGSIGVMEQGRLVISGRIDEIVRRFEGRKRLIVEILNPVPTTADWLAAVEGVSGVIEVDGRFEFDFEGSDQRVAELLRFLIQEKAPVKAFYERKMGVEDILLKVGARMVS